jgi:adenylate kinase
VKTRIVLLGPPASGKGVQAEKLKVHFGIPSASPGAMLREEKRQGTPLGIEADRITQDGSMVSDFIVISLVREWLKTHSGKFLFDGFPRDIEQAEALEELLHERGETLDAVLFFDAPEQVVERRILNRVMCPACGGSFGIGIDVNSGDVPCPVCGGKLVRRTDDTIEAFRNRMEQYREKTCPLVEFYRERGLLKTVKADLAPDAVFSEIISILEAPGV